MLATASTIFHRTRTAITVWFAAARHLTPLKTWFPQKRCIVFSGLVPIKPLLAMLHRLRCATSHAMHDMLSVQVEADEAVFGGVRHGKLWRGAEGNGLVAVAVELLSPKEAQQARIDDHADWLASYPCGAKDEYIHHGTSINGSRKKANEVLPGTHRVASDR